MTRKRHARAVREIAAAIDRRLQPAMPSYDKDMTVEVENGREPIIRISIRVKP